MSITLITGPMFSGKTTELTRQIDIETIIGNNCVIIKHVNDTRYCDDNKIITHFGKVYDKCDIILRDNLNDEFCNELIEKYQVVGIDEGFMFNNISHYCNLLADNGLKVIIASINSSYIQKKFEEISNLMATCEYLIKLYSVCNFCKKKAHFTVREIEDDREIIVGGNDIYKAVCRKCKNKLFKN